MIRRLGQRARLCSNPRRCTIAFMSKLLSLAYWNGLTREHLSDVVMVLTATILALIDIPLRRIVKRLFRNSGPVFRFAVFVTLCSFGFAAIAMLVSWGLKWTLTFQKGHYMAPLAFGILIAVGFIAARQKEF
jgi:hypothetical protein